MGKLYDLVKFKNDILKSSDGLSVADCIYEKIQIVEQTKEKNIKINNIELLDGIINQYTDLIAQNNKILENLGIIISQLDDDIDSIATELFSDDEYKKAFCEEAINAKTLHPTKEVDAHVKSKIHYYGNWQYPALYINPREKSWIDSLVACDPLYLSSIDVTSINELISGYPEIYQRRLRIYQIENRDYSKLPQEQFSLVFCWDTFNYLSFDKVERYIRQVFNLLRPGGGFIFSYSNCDLEEVAFRAECRATAYSTYKLVANLLTEIGYEIVQSHDIKTEDAFNTHISWIEAKKPGILTTIKAHQAIAQIIAK